MRGEFNGLQRKILDENSYAFYVHFKLTVYNW
jgi:hypothetical protein